MLLRSCSGSAALWWDELMQYLQSDLLAGFTAVLSALRCVEEPDQGLCDLFLFCA